MHGSKSASDHLASWTTLAVEEVGGFAGLRRGAKLARANSTPAEAERIADLLKHLNLEVRAAPGHSSPGMPDGQVLVVRVKSKESDWEAELNTADLPESAAELLALLPDLKPMAYD